MELFERVQERLDGTTYTRPRELKFAYGGLLTCGHCGATITAEIKKKKYVYYRCAQRCEAVAYVREERVREQFIEAMRPLRMAESVREAVKRTLRESRARIEDDVRARVAAAQERIERLGRLIDKAYEDKLEGRIEDHFFMQNRMKWEKQRTEAVGRSSA
ncbi:MAG: recombinase zinc beta ribbon domain-containing protein [Deltaproteobacteria bacterium]|nr:recombinase zinc beta ribbon domain-containing protein [Deltaproteobacteria bacterium]